MAVVVLIAAGTLPAGAAPTFSDDDRARLVAFWNAPGRYVIGAPPDAVRTGPWQVRLTPGASRWFWKLQRALGPGKTPPTSDVKPQTPETADWEPWIEQKLTFDQWQAEAAADAANAVLRPIVISPDRGSPPPPPGPIPATLLAAAGDPPAFAAAVAPLRYTVTFEDGESYGYDDNVQLRPRYAYYRFPQGTVAYGPMLRDTPEAELDSLFSAAGLNPSEQHVMKAVSKLEGGFETINTYDTGYVSIGFIQFVTLDTGRESLSEVLAQEKRDQPADYDRDFHRLGIDVDAAGTLAVVDPSTGAELVGLPAVLRVVDDKRLTAVFQRAGRHSRAFRVAQIKVAKSHYWAGDDPVAVTIDARAVSGRVSDVIHSEAGLATLFDRKVNRGTIAPFEEILTKVMTDHHLTTLPEAAPYEREILPALTYRRDFLADATLSQPAPPPVVPEGEAKQ